MDYKEAYDLTEHNLPADNELVARVSTAVVLEAKAILEGGATGTPEEKYAKRKWAAQVLYNPDSEAKKAARLVIAENIDLPLATVLNAIKNDTQIQGQVAAVVPELIQALAGKDATD
jgi:hypothetical protein